MINSLDVYLWGKKVGTLIPNRTNHKNLSCFYFDKNYIQSGYDIAPIRASINSTSAKLGLPFYSENEKIFGGLPSFVADSLPDHWGNTVFTQWANMHNIKAKDITPLDRLAYIGNRGLGALEFVPSAAPEMETSFKVELDSLAEIAQKTVLQASKFEANYINDLMVESLFKVGTSAGGKRPKAVINVNLENGDCLSGQVSSPNPNYTSMIIKFDEHIAMPTTRIEYSYYLMAVSAGLAMKPCRLIDNNGSTHFLTERFDRINQNKIHIQSLAAMKPYANSYEDLFDVGKQLHIQIKEMQQLFLAMVLNVFACNVDDHSKNFSFMMDKDGVWKAAPTYDFTFSIDTEAPSYMNRHSMSINRKVDNITIDDLLYIANKYDIKSANTLISKAKDTTMNYSQFGKEAGVDAKWINIIENEIKKRN